MPARRLRPIAAPIQLTVDGKRIAASEGEPVAIALAAAGRTLLGRSVKYHRPRGAACYFGRCDGCLMRVDGRQSVMTCRVGARDAMVIETQNVLGSAKRDLLAASDWFFPEGMNHHEMFTWNEQVNRMMQKVARRVAGVGKLPAQIVPPTESSERSVDVLVVGGGPAGLCAASECARRGLSTLLVDENDAAGGSLRFWPVPIEGRPGSELAAQRIDEADKHGVEIRTRAAALGVYAPWEDAAGAITSEGDPAAERRVVAVDEPSGLVRVHPRRLVLAPGRHESTGAFEGSDLPGVIDVRGACILLAHGVLPGERVVIASGERSAAERAGASPTGGVWGAIGPPERIAGAGTLADALAIALREHGAHVLGPIPQTDLHRAHGRSSVRACDLRDQRGYECDLIVLAPPSSAVYELAAQAGVEVSFTGTSYELAAAPDDGKTSVADVRVIGWAARQNELAAALAQAERAAASIATELEAR